MSSLSPQLVFSSTTQTPFTLDTPGPVDYLTRRYTVAQVQNPGAIGPPTHLRIYMSSDAGLTWTEQDAAHAPLFTGGSNNCGFFYPKAGGNTFYMCFSEDAAGTSGALHLTSFNMDTNLFGADVGGGPTNVVNGTVKLFRRTDTSFVILYDTGATGGGVKAHWTTYSGGWGAVNDIPLATEGLNTSDGNKFYSALMDASDRVHFLSDQHLLLSIWYGSISSANAASALQNTLVGNPFNANTSGWGDYVPLSDTVIFPISTYDSNGQGGTPQGGVIKCHPSVGPSFNYETVNIAQFSDPIFAGLPVRLMLSPDGTTERFLWLTHSLTVPTNNDIFYAVQAGGTTSWSGSTVLWNYVANPPNPVPPITGVEPLWAISWSSDGVIGVVLSGWITELAQNFCDIEYYLSVDTGPAPPGPLALACPTVTTGIVGNPFLAFLQVSGGFPPYTFVVTGGSLPPGLSLNSVTGEISGTPTLDGTFSYTITVMDSHDQMAVVACQIVIPRSPRMGAQTLRWQCPSPGRPGRWFPHLYHDPVVTHYLVEPTAASPNDQELFMLAGGAILKSGGNTDAGAPIIVIAEPGSIDNGDERAQKLYVDAMTEADQVGTISSQIRFNNSQQTGPTLLLNPTGVRQQFLENIASLADLALYRNISTRYTWTGGPDGPRIYAFEPAGYLQPYISLRMVTQYINLSFPGWKSFRRLYPGLISNADVIFTVETQDNRVFTTVIPSTGGQFRIVPLIIAHGCKGLSFGLQLDGQGTPFALFPESFTCEVKEWTEATYIDLAVWKS